MTVGELKEILEGFDDEVEVRLAMQPNWPFEYSVSDSVAIAGEGDNFDDYDAPAGAVTILYLAEDRQLDYLPGHIREQLRW